MHQTSTRNILISVACSFSLSLLVAFASIYLYDTQIKQTTPLQAEIPKQVIELKNTEDEFISDLVEDKRKAVVSIVIHQEFVHRNPTPDFFFEDFFFGNPPSQSPSQPRFNVPQEQQQDIEPELREVGGGTGFFIREDGLIVTNKHVVSNTKAKYTILTSDGESFDAEIQAFDPFFDLAIIQITDTKGKKFPTLDLGDSDSIRAGQTVLAIGNALAEFSGSVTKGIISGLDRTAIAGDGRGRAERLDNVIQVDVAINPGNSGGPLITLDGKVVGINTAVANAENVGFALPVNDMKQAIESYLANGKILRPKLGVRYVILNSEIQEENDLDYDYGALIIRGPQKGQLAIIPGGPADKAGLEENDIILEINGVKVDEVNPLLKQIQQFKIGDTIILKIFHDEEEKEVEVVLEEIESNK